MKNKEILELIVFLKKIGIHLESKDGKLRVFGKLNSLLDEHKVILRENKGAILDFCIKREQQNSDLNISISPALSLDLYPVSNSQRRLWVLSQLEGGSFAYNMPGVYAFEGDLNKKAFVSSFDVLLERHESLRTVFVSSEKGEIYQKIKTVNDLDFKVSELDYQNQSEEALQKTIKAELGEAFDLEKGPLLKASLYQTASNKSVFTFVMHHIISDGWSMDILIRDLLTIYNAKVNGNPIPLDPLKIHYKDYAVWLQDQLKGPELEIHEKYWLEQFDGELPVLDLPSDYIRPAVQTYNGSLLTGSINKDLSNKLNTITKEKGATLFMGLLSLVNTLFHRYTNQKDIILGIPIAGRDHADLENQIGFYVNTLALRTQFEGNNSFNELLSNTKDVTLGAYNHQMYPFDELVDKLTLSRDMSRNPLFDVMVALQNNDTSSGGQILEDVNVTPYIVGEHIVSQFDMSYDFKELDNGEIAYSIEYNTDIYSKESVTQMSNHLIQLLEQITLNPDQSIIELDFLSKKEKHQLLEEFNNTEVNCPNEKTIVQLFEEQVGRTPDNIAIVFEGKKISYKEINLKANQLGYYLRSNYDIKADDLIGIKLDRSEWMIIAMLGVLKSGGAYVPIDISYPADRVSYMVQNSNCKIVVDDQELALFNEYYETGENNDKIEYKPSQSDLAYVIYTSGSTGTPKGVMVEHNSLMDYVLSSKDEFKIKAIDKVIQQSLSSFDTHIEEIFPILLAGGEILLSKNGGKDIHEIITLINQGATVLSTTPFVIKELNKEEFDLNQLRLIISGGDLFYTSYASRFIGKIDVYNTYGPSEATVCSTYSKIKQEITTNSIGFPIKNRRVLILNSVKKIVPQGVVGEINIGGVGVARGYINRPELTAEKFIINPFKKEERLYSTGDLGRWKSDGSIEFIGRNDHQVKVRGYRIELGEVESALQQLEGVDSCVVLAKEIGNYKAKELVGYIKGSELSISGLRKELSKVLPNFMIPSHFVALKDIPLTANGKIDKKALPNPEGLGMSTGVEYLAPTNAIEEQLVLIWSEVLGIEKDKIGINDNFFDLSGHSLKAIKLLSFIHKHFEVKQGLRDFFGSPILSSQSAFISTSIKVSFFNIKELKIQPNYKVSSSQRRLWVLSQFEEVNLTYNMPELLAFDGDLDKEVFVSSFDVLLERHESLRTIFVSSEEGDIQQEIKTVNELGFKVSELNYQNQSEEALQKTIKAELNEAFDLEKGPLLKASLYLTASNKSVFTFAMHHIISDGWSMGVLIRDLLTIYNAKVNDDPIPLKPLRIHYKEYAAWQQEQLKGPEFENHKKYWLEQFSGELPVLDLPSDYTRPAVQTYNGSLLNGSINKDLSGQLNQLSKEKGGTLFMGLLSLVNTLFHRYTGQEDIVLGSPIAGRDHVELENQIGFYVNTLALRTQFEGSNSFNQLLENIKEVTLGAYEHQVYPFDELVDELNLSRDMSRNPLFDVMVVLQNNDTSTGGQTLGGVNVTPYKEREHMVSKFDLTYNFSELESGELAYSLEYNTDIYSERLMNQMGSHLVQLLEEIVENPNQSINELDYLDKNEKRQLLEEFNDNKVDYPKDKTIIDLFEEQVGKTPDNKAVVFEEIELTYKELNEKSNQLGHYLRSTYNIKPDDLIGIKLDRSEQMIVTILGVLKSGGAYVPIDPEYPGERVEYMEKDSGCKLIIDKEALQVFEAISAEYSKNNLSQVTSPSDLAYVIYTSGTTGNPKGVLLEQRNIVRLFKSDDRLFDFSENDVWTMFHSYCFDFSVWEMYGALLFGGKLIVVSNEVAKIPSSYLSLLSRHSVTILNQTPSAFYNLMDEAILNKEAKLSLRNIIFGGEALQPEKLKGWYENYPDVSLINMYGITETTVHVTYKKITSKEIETGESNIGNPIPTLSCYLFDSNNNLTPVGVVGELHVSGSGLARGYLNRPDLTSEKFIPHPYKINERIYKTGDIAKRLLDGNLEYLGRIDDQVKIRGYRIELGEVESSLQQLKGVDSCVILAREFESRQELVAYIIGRDLSISNLRSELGKQLPSYMIPSHFVELEEFPLTSNGKVDKKALPNPEGLGMGTGIEYIAPRNETEERLVKIWSKVLGIGKKAIGINDNFFDLGGDSIKSIIIKGEIERSYELKLNAKELFQNLTISDLAEHIDLIKLVNKPHLIEGKKEIFEL